MTVFQRPVDATFAAFGIEAVYMPTGGDPVPVRVIARRPDTTVGFGDTRIHAETATFEVRASKVANPRQDDQLIFDGQAFIIRASGSGAIRTAGMDARCAGELDRLAEPLVQQLQEAPFQLMSDAVGRVDEINKRFDIGLSRRIVPTNGSQPAQFADDPVSLLQQVIELLVTSGDRRRIVADVCKNRPSGVFEMILELSPWRASRLRPYARLRC